MSPRQLPDEVFQVLNYFVIGASIFINALLDFLGERGLVIDILLGLLILSFIYYNIARGRARYLEGRASDRESKKKNDNGPKN